MTFTHAQRFAFMQFQYYVHWQNETKAREWFAKIGYAFPYEVGIHALHHMNGKD
jgi:hypothetical protein